MTWQDGTLGTLGRSGGRAMVDTVLPPQELLGLGGDMGGDDLTRRMWADVTFLDAPWCEACGFPFEYAVAENLTPLSGQLCARCAVRRPAYDRVRAPMAYDDGWRGLWAGSRPPGSIPISSRESGARRAKAGLMPGRV